MTYTPTLRLKQYLYARKAKPMPHLGDIIHSVNVGSPYEGELLLSDLREFAESHEKLAKALRKCLNYIENTEEEFHIDMQCGDMARAALEGLE